MSSTSDQSTIAGAGEHAGGAAARGPDGDRTHAAIELQGVGMRFRMHSGRLSPTLKATVVETITRRRSRPRDFWVFQDLDISIASGERVGVIGANGAGKTTLIKLIAGVYAPAHGTVRVTGRVAPLVELATGLNMELSGVENILLLGSLLGHPPEVMLARAPAILEFAGLREFAEAPMKSYSTGMISRLSFSIATNVDPQILLLDEVFAGGDAEFVPRATERMHELMDASHIVVFVSHSLRLVRELTDRTLWIEHGRVVQDGPTGEVCDAYAASIAKR